MQTTLRLADSIHRQAKAEAARRGVTLTKFIEDAVQAYVQMPPQDAARRAEIEERNQLMEELLKRTAGFKIGSKPSRDEMNDRPALR